MKTPLQSLFRHAGAQLLAATLCACGDGGAGGEEDRPAQAVKNESVKLLAALAPELDSIRVWNDQALDTARSLALTDAQSARLYAMVNVALYDAVNGIDSQNGVAREAALVPIAGGPKKGHASAAAAAAAHALLTRLYPARSAVYDARLHSELAGVPDGSPRTEGLAWGVSVGSAVYQLRQQDGSESEEIQAAGSTIGAFRADWSGVQFRRLAPFVTASPDLYATFTPPALDSDAYAIAFDDVKIAGNAAVPDPLGLETYRFWSSGSGTSQPPGEWIKIGLSLSAQQGLALPESARLLALLGMAMSDVVAPTFSMKFNNHAWRPTTAIREADLDGNAGTIADPGWSARAGTAGGSPEAVSGHSSFSGAAATVLRGYFCSDSIAFNLQSDAAPNGARQYGSFTQAEDEAGRSRVLGGVHFEFSNKGGQQAGRGVGAEVLSKALLRSHGQTHHGSCPK